MENEKISEQNMRRNKRPNAALWLLVGNGREGDNSEPKLQGLPTSFLAEGSKAETEPWNIIIWEEEIGA